MELVLYINGQRVDAMLLSQVSNNLSQLKQQLADKHKELLKQAGAKPVFVIENVPSAINHFQPLRTDIKSEHS